jgi:putative endonuclease
LYTGVCHSIHRRRAEHKERVDSRSYTARYGLYRLVYLEPFHYIKSAIAREKQIKRWSRTKKIRLIESANPKWDDLSREWGTAVDFAAIVRAAAQGQNQGPSTSPAQAGSARDDNPK